MGIFLRNETKDAELYVWLFSRLLVVIVVFFFFFFTSSP